MSKKIVWAGAGALAVLLLAGGGAWKAGWLGAGGGVAQAKAGESAGATAGKKAEGNADKGADKGSDKGPDKPSVTLEFASREVVQPVRARLGAQVEFSGPLVAPQTAQLRSRMAGTLLDLTVAEGQRVRAGQVVGRLDLAEAGTRVAERSALLESARAALAQAERTHANNERLAAQQFISASALDSSRLALDGARAQLAAAQAALDTARVGLREATLVAPIGGIVARRHALPGEKLAAEQPVLTIVDLATLELAGRVGTHEVARLAPGLPVQVQVEGVDAPVAGRLARIAPAAEPGTRSIGVTIELANPQERLRAGQYAMARVQLADDTERLVLPMAAVGQTSGQDHVWVIDQGQLARRAVTLGRRDEREGRVEVLQGVTPASVVLAARFDNLREGAKATVVPAKAPPVASAAASSPALR